MSLEDFVDQLIAEKTKVAVASVMLPPAGKHLGTNTSEAAEAGDSLSQMLDKMTAQRGDDGAPPTGFSGATPQLMQSAQSVAVQPGGTDVPPPLQVMARLGELQEQVRSKDEQLLAQNEQLTALRDKLRQLIGEYQRLRDTKSPAASTNDHSAATAGVGAVADIGGQNIGAPAASANAASFPWKRHLAAVQEYLKNKDTVTSEASLKILVDAADAIPVELGVRIRLMTQLSTIRLESKDYRQAEDTLQQALSLIEGAQQHKTVATAFCLDALAQCRQEQDDFDQAEKLRREAVVIADECLGGEHPDASYFRERLDTLRQERSIATIGSDEGSRTVLDKLTDEYNAAVASGQPAGPLVDNTAPDMVAGLMFDKYVANGKAALNQKNMREAESALRSAMEKAEKLPNSDPRKCEGARLLASALQMQGKDQEAKQLYETCLTVAFRYIGWNDIHVAQSLSALADIHSGSNDFGLAKNYYKQALAAMKTLLGSDHETVKALDQKYQEFLARVKEERRWKGWSA